MNLRHGAYAADHDISTRRGRDRIRALVLIAVVALAGCGGGTRGTNVAPGITTWHDDANGVTCYIFAGFAASCVRDK